MRISARNSCRPPSIRHRSLTPRTWSSSRRKPASAKSMSTSIWTTSPGYRALPENPSRRLGTCSRRHRPREERDRTKGLGAQPGLYRARVIPHQRRPARYRHLPDGGLRPLQVRRDPRPQGTGTRNSSHCRGRFPLTQRQVCACAQGTLPPAARHRAAVNRRRTRSLPWQVLHYG